ncbi:MAG: hypothetical protein H6557_12100 [Lewinellaceae bacterium]|nr:hypothetical protein [Lewinellaceae bacterium]
MINFITKNNSPTSSYFPAMPEKRTNGKPAEASGHPVKYRCRLLRLKSFQAWL